MWIWMSLGSALLLGVYDVAKKHALKRNSVLWVLLAATAISSLLLSPFLTAGTMHDHTRMILKAILVTSSWVSGLAALKSLPITTASSIKASRPIIVIALSLAIFGEKLNVWQWAGVITVIIALWLLSRSSKKEGIAFAKSRGITYMVVSVLTGAASALFDKYIMADMQPLFVQSWANIYITVMLAACTLVQRFAAKSEFKPFKWDWTLVVIAVFIVAADMLYFFALKQEGALLSVISLIRRSSVIVTFSLGAWLFKEHNIKDKAIDLAIILVGLFLLFWGSSIA